MLILQWRDDTVPVHRFIPHHIEAVQQSAIEVAMDGVPRITVSVAGGTAIATGALVVNYETRMVDWVQDKDHLLLDTRKEYPNG